MVGVLGIRTWDRRMVGADKSSELWPFCCFKKIFKSKLNNYFLPKNIVV